MERTKKMELHISCLPEEILEIIFSYLSVDQKLKAALVCKDWLKALDCSVFLQDILCKLVGGMHDSSSSVALPLTRKFSCFSFDRVIISYAHLQLLKEHGIYIKELEFIQCFMDERIRKNCHEHMLCKNLTVLKFQDCFLNIFTSLPMLNVLKYGYMDIYGETIECDLLQKVLPTILEFENGSGSRDMRPYNTLIENCPDLIFSHFLSHQNFEFILSLMEKHKQIRFKKLNIFNDAYLNHGVISKLLTNQNRLIELFLSNVDSDNMELILKYLPLLKILDIDNYKLVDSSIQHIFQLRHLQELNIKMCSEIGRIFLSSAVKNTQLFNLNKLELSACPSLDDTLIAAILGKLPQLRWLSLKENQGISNATVKFISKNHVYLRHLELWECKNISDDGIYDALKPEESISNIKGLRDLTLVGLQITTDGLVRAVKFLELHSLRMFKSLSDDVKMSLREQNPNLVNFSVREENCMVDIRYLPAIF